MNNNKRLFVAGLPFATSEEELRNLFATVGVVVSASVIIDKFTGRSKGFGFVEMGTPEEAIEAIAKLHESDFGGRKLIVAEAKPMEKRENAPRRNDNRQDRFDNRQVGLDKRDKGDSRGARHGGGH